MTLIRVLGAFCVVVFLGFIYATIVTPVETPFVSPIQVTVLLVAWFLIGLLSKVLMVIGKPNNLLSLFSFGLCVLAFAMMIALLPLNGSGREYGFLTNLVATAWLVSWVVADVWIGFFYGLVKQGP